jgi:hypothetical protein
VNAFGCLVYNNGFHGIVTGSAGTANIYLCTVHDCGALNNGTVGIFVPDTVNSHVYMCEAYNMKTSGANDGNGFNVDGSNGGTALVEQCYAHDNQGFGWLFDTYIGVNTVTMRFCISQNNATVSRTGNAEVVMTTSDATAGVALTMYNCTFYSSKPAIVYGTNQAISVFSGNICNNIFYSVSGAKFVAHVSGDTVGNPTNLVFNGNDYYTTWTFSLDWNGATYTSLAAWKAAYTNQETINGGLTADPQLFSPGGGGILGGYHPESLSQYVLNLGSPCIGSGIDLQKSLSINPGGQDFYGTAVKNLNGTYNVGAYVGGVIGDWIRLTG